MIPTMILPSAPQKQCERCKKPLRLIAQRQYGPHTEYVFTGCKCFATQTVIMPAASPAQRSK